MKKIYEVLRQRPCKGDVGIEIEVEGAGLVFLEDKYWRSEKDGSLRGAFPGEACEYVLNIPIKLSEVPFAMASLNEALKASVPDFSFRTSTHIHVNVQALTEDQLLAMIYTYLLLEEPLMTFCGRERKCNRFCLRLQDAEGLLDIINDVVEHGVESLAMQQGDGIRYAAINLDAVRKYGSLEFRAMRGTLDNGVISTWAESLCALRSFALQMDTVEAVYQHFLTVGPEQFMADVLKERAAMFVNKSVRRDMLQSFSLSIDFAANVASVKRQKALLKTAATEQAAVRAAARVNKQKVNAFIDNVFMENAP